CTVSGGILGSSFATTCALGGSGEARYEDCFRGASGLSSTLRGNVFEPLLAELKDDRLWGVFVLVLLSTEEVARVNDLLIARLGLGVRWIVPRLVRDRDRLAARNDVGGRTSCGFQVIENALFELCLILSLALPVHDRLGAVVGGLEDVPRQELLLFGDIEDLPDRRIAQIAKEEGASSHLPMGEGDLQRQAG